MSEEKNQKTEKTATSTKKFPPFNREAIQAAANAVVATAAGEKVDFSETPCVGCGGEKEHVAKLLCVSCYNLRGCRSGVRAAERAIDREVGEIRAAERRAAQEKAHFEASRKALLERVGGLKDARARAAIRKAAQEATTGGEIDEAWSIFKVEMHNQSRNILLGVLKGLKKDVAGLAPKASSNGALKGQVAAANKAITEVKAMAEAAETREELQAAWDKLDKATAAVERVQDSVSHATMSKIKGGSGGGKKGSNNRRGGSSRAAVGSAADRTLAQHRARQQEKAA